MGTVEQINLQRSKKRVGEAKARRDEAKARRAELESAMDQFPIDFANGVYDERIRLFLRERSARRERSAKPRLTLVSELKGEK